MKSRLVGLDTTLETEKQALNRQRLAIAECVHFWLSQRNAKPTKYFFCEKIANLSAICSEIVKMHSFQTEHIVSNLISSQENLLTV